VALLLDAPAEGADLWLYSEAMTCVAKQHVDGPFGPGWSHASLDVSRLAGGLYFLRSGAVRTRVYLLR
jgi:hypothetical protein